MADRATPFAAPVTGSHAGTSRFEPHRGSLWQIACWPDSFAAVEAQLASACGCTAPAPGRISITDQDAMLIRIEPLKWWVIGYEGAECPVDLDPETGAVLDMSHDQAAIGIEVDGSGDPEILKRMVSLDLREHAFPDLSFATTEMHHMITRVLRRDEDGARRYQVLVMRSYADTVHEVIQHHLHHLG